MKILHRYFAQEIIKTVFLVGITLLLLFGFFDFIHEINDLGKGSYSFDKIGQFVFLKMFGHLYEIMPIVTLISAMVVLGRFAHQYELIVMRVSGLSTLKLSKILLIIGLGLGFLTFCIGEYLTPSTEKLAQQVKVDSIQSVIAKTLKSGVWVKDKNNFVNIQDMRSDSELNNIKIYQFNDAHELINLFDVKKAVFDQKLLSWQLFDIQKLTIINHQTEIQQNHMDTMLWKSNLTPKLIGVLVVNPEQMSAENLYSYILHLEENLQQSQRYKIALWNKIAYPLASAMMLLIALPFAYQSPRQGNLGSKIFIGIMIGLGFNLASRLFSHLGLIYNWSASISALLPSFILFITAFGSIYFLERSSHQKQSSA